MIAYDDIVRADVIVVGSGVAGVTTALASPSATILTKGSFGEDGSSAWAQGGIAGALAPDDSPASHAADTVAVAGGIANTELVNTLAAGGPEAIEHLIALGAKFDHNGSGGLALGGEAGHSACRIVHADGDATGAELMRTLRAAARARPSIDIVEHTTAIDLARSGDRIVGVLTSDADDQRVLYLGRAVVLATGGIGQLYSRTTNPVPVTGDGLAMAARAGAKLADLEFVQFHPTALATGGDPMPLLTEALRGEGAVLIDDEGNRFMTELHLDAELAPRDVVARANWQQMSAGRKVYLDATQAVGASFPNRFPTVFAAAMHAGIDPRTEPLPVSPAAHYFMGGIAVDHEGSSSLPGLWAVGEASSTGVHGANRLASNSLLEGLVFGRKVGASMLRSVGYDQHSIVQLPAPPRATSGGDHVIQQIRKLMWENVGLVRHETSLEEALHRLEQLAADSDSLAARNAITVARLVASAARARTESRGAHYRTDYPEQDPSQATRSFVTPAPVPAPLFVESELAA